MRAVVIDDFGAVPAVREVPEPVVGPGEVKVQVRGSSVNQFDTMLAAGFLKGMYEHVFPITLGQDFSGVVTEIGEGDTDFAVGDKVFGVVGKSRLTDGGGYAEYLTTAATHGIAKIPDGVDWATAGVLGLAGAAAAASVNALGDMSGKTVLVSGATGGVGAHAVQLVVAGGATVIATATPGTETEHVLGLGAQHAVDHRGDLAAQVKELAPNGVDSVVHLAGDGPSLADLLVDGGHIVSPAHLTQEQMGDRNVKVTAVMATPTRPVLDQIARNRVAIAHTYSFNEVAAAFTALKAGVIGKLAISID
nr:NADP-dependent oxidoreductase [Kibdelosporangium sp. MJ126-NF4]CEL21736.1 Bifunctional protein: zinc-containing alcohol dehydrogenase; quinone oxidoreductase (NADPH:quinone reductase); Similar to arginate lyase [Kibdelosporangium sp. MJ126-NF4]CTQ92516.1 Bifunctional protein: zinc-containing alcohol dehydrogenase; quinone oxidoreductase (NADPH:quinone reductase) (EC 1.1.1.-); Similar to arginate lyase [Kibdelosporangium sp. MJ126-NF4]